ncbi:hypothetical protein EV384_1250 [Micromonospora kangleipakensis]|uniref:Uncharacterized protein n=2 Tax=Micromonospora kangleipakensis TaxID=1077942 RepID=A0A4Q8B5K0_9ACTN|nr:hypothetical protein EV384_1250 [Micromonospora kangleipakensis]
MGARPGPEDGNRIIFGGELRLMGCFAFLVAVLMLTGPRPPVGRPALTAAGGGMMAEWRL